MGVFCVTQIRNIFPIWVGCRLLPDVVWQKEKYISNFPYRCLSRGEVVWQIRITHFTYYKGFTLRFAKQIMLRVLLVRSFNKVLTIIFAYVI